MKMHPTLAIGVSLGKYKPFQKKEILFIQDENGNKYELDRPVYEALKKADGFHPIIVPGYQNIIEKMEELDLICTSRNEKLGNHSSAFILSGIPEQLQQKTASFCQMLNLANIFASILSLVLLPALLYFVILIDTEPVFSLPIYLSLSILSLYFHEIGHITAMNSFNIYVNHIGVLLLCGFLPIGAFVSPGAGAIDMRDRAKRLQIALSGIEINFILGSFFLLCALLNTRFWFTYAALGLTNILLAERNLIPAYSLDGEEALSAILYDGAAFWFSPKWKRQRIIKGIIKASLYLSIIGTGLIFLIIGDVI